MPGNFAKVFLPGGDSARFESGGANPGSDVTGVNLTSLGNPVCQVVQMLPKDDSTYFAGFARPAIVRFDLSRCSASLGLLDGDYFAVIREFVPGLQLRTSSVQAVSGSLDVPMYGYGSMSIHTKNISAQPAAPERIGNTSQTATSSQQSSVSVLSDFSAMCAGVTAPTSLAALRIVLAGACVVSRPQPTAVPTATLTYTPQPNVDVVTTTNLGPFAIMMPTPSIPTSDTLMGGILTTSPSLWVSLSVDLAQLRGLMSPEPSLFSARLRTAVLSESAPISSAMLHYKLDVSLKQGDCSAGAPVLASTMLAAPFSTVLMYSGLSFGVLQISALNQPGLMLTDPTRMADLAMLTMEQLAARPRANVFLVVKLTGLAAYSLMITSTAGTAGTETFTPDEGNLLHGLGEFSQLCIPYGNIIL